VLVFKGLTQEDMMIAWVCTPDIAPGVIDPKASPTKVMRYVCYWGVSGIYICGLLFFKLHNDNSAALA